MLYWCGFGDGDTPASVRRLLELARAHGRAAYYIQSGGFDDLMLRIALHSLEAVSYTHLDVYKRQVSAGSRTLIPLPSISVRNRASLSRTISETPVTSSE